jgi:ribosomal protein L7/L12
MIKLELTVREAMNLATSWAFNNDIVLYHKIVDAFETAVNGEDVGKNCTVTITKGMSLNNRIPCIKAIRQYTGWGLKETKDWTDDLVGGWKGDRFVPATHHTSSITLKYSCDAENLLRELTTLGCEGHLS